MRLENSICLGFLPSFRGMACDSLGEVTVAGAVALSLLFTESALEEKALHAYMSLNECVICMFVPFSKCDSQMVTTFNITYIFLCFNPSTYMHIRILRLNCRMLKYVVLFFTNYCI